jgi:hypothetical protein
MTTLQNHSQPRVSFIILLFGRIFGLTIFCLAMARGHGAEIPPSPDSIPDQRPSALDAQYFALIQAEKFKNYQLELDANKRLLRELENAQTILQHDIVVATTNKIAIPTMEKIAETLAKLQSSLTNLKVMATNEMLKADTPQVLQFGKDYDIKRR